MTQQAQVIDLNSRKDCQPLKSTQQQSSETCKDCNGYLVMPRPKPGYPNAWGPCNCVWAEHRKRQFAELLKKARMTEMSDMTFDSYMPENERQQKALQIVRERDRSYYLYGNYGVGKTHLMVAMALRAMEKGRPAVLINVPQLLQAIRKAGRDTATDIEDLASRIPILCLDDIGKQKDSDWTEERLFMLIDARWKLQRNDKGFTCFTSQYSIDHLAQRLDGATISRIRGMTWPIYMDGEDYRLRERR